MKYFVSSKKKTLLLLSLFLKELFFLSFVGFPYSCGVFSSLYVLLTWHACTHLQRCVHLFVHMCVFCLPCLSVLLCASLGILHRNWCSGQSVNTYASLSVATHSEKVENQGILMHTCRGWLSTGENVLY